MNALTGNQTADEGKYISIQKYWLRNEGQNITAPKNLKYLDPEYRQLLTA